jgi:hypothetical protein
MDGKSKQGQSQIGVKTNAIEAIVVLFLMGAGVCLWVTPHTWHTPGFSNQNFSKIKVGTQQVKFTRSLEIRITEGTMVIGYSLGRDTVFCRRLTGKKEALWCPMDL